MKKSILFLLLLLPIILAAQNHLVYLRYNPGQGDATTIVSHIDTLYDGNNKVIVFFSQAEESVVAKNETEWETLKLQLLSMQGVPDLYATSELEQLNALLNDILGEYVNTSNKLSISGTNDRVWDFRCILSKEMYAQTNDLEIVPLEFIDINELNERMKVTYLMYDEIGNISTCPIPHHNIFNF